MYNATLYFNSGFNAVNIPDSPATLARATAKTYPALDIYQARELSSFIIRATYSDIRDADYLYLVNADDQTDFAYYSIQGIAMTSKDTAVLSVAMDYILTAGGASALTFTDGLVERHHVAKADDDFGAYDENDPYMAPAEMLNIDVDIPDFKDGETGELIFLQSTVDLRETYRMREGFIQFNAVDFVTPRQTTAEDPNFVTVPVVEPGNLGCTVQMLTPSNPFETKVPYVNMYVANATDLWNNAEAEWITLALPYIRSLGVEGCILAQYAIPKYMVDPNSVAAIYLDPDDPNHAALNVGLLDTLKGRNLRVTCNLPFFKDYQTEYGYTVQNNRIYYGESSKYTITSLASGNSADFLPEEIYYGTDPVVEMRVDPRPDGCPYFRFEHYRGIPSYGTDDNLKQFFINCVKGLPWQNVPLLYQGASGSFFNRYNYAATMTKAGLGHDYGSEVAGVQQTYDNYRNAIGAVEDIANAIGSTTTATAVSMIDGAISSKDSSTISSNNPIGALMSLGKRAMNFLEGNQTTDLYQDNATAEYYLTRNKELTNLMRANRVIAPSIQFPMAEGIRDFVGNDVLVYRTYFRENDVKRIDKILNMYGYKHTVPMDTAYLTNRSKFNYIQVRGVSIGNKNIPKWLRDGIAAQFSVGTRIWHQLPDIAAYTDGSNT